MNKSLYYIVELSVSDGLSETVLVKEEDLARLLDNYDKEIYTVINIYGVGPINLEHKDFLKKEKGLELGKE
jgi:hypothetical protein